MATEIEATFDGAVFRPVGSISLPPNTTVRLTVEPIPERPASFLRTAQSLNLEGAPDWSKRLGQSDYDDQSWTRDELQALAWEVIKRQNRN